MNQERPAARFSLVAAVVAVAVLAACGGGGDGRVDRLTASGAWARPTPAGAASGVVYLSVRTDRPDTLVGATVDAAVARAASLHTTMGAGDGAAHHGGGASDGTVSMKPVESFPADPDEPLVFEPGGNHVMLEDLARPIERGERFSMTLTFSSGRSLVVPVAVRDNPPD